MKMAKLGFILSALPIRLSRRQPEKFRSKWPGNSINSQVLGWLRLATKFEKVDCSCVAI